MTYKLNILNDLPSAYWGFENSGTDSSGTNLSLSFPVSPTFGHPGLVPGSSSARFAADQHGTVNIKNIMVRGREKKSFGLEVWVKCTPPTDTRLIMGRSTGGIYLTPNGIEFSVAKEDGSVSTAYYTVVDWNASFYVIANLSGNYLTITVNGDKGESATLDGEFLNTSTVFYVGGSGTSSDTIVYLDEAAVYSRPVHARTLFRHLDRGNSGEESLDVLQLFSGAYYSFADDSVVIGQDIVESSSDELYSGTITGDLDIVDGRLVGTDGEKTSRPYWLGDLGVVDGSRLSYDASSGVTLEVSLDNGATWTSAANDSEVPGISQNTDMSGKFIQYRAKLRGKNAATPISTTDTTTLSVTEGSSSSVPAENSIKSSADALGLSITEASSNATTEFEMSKSATDSSNLYLSESGTFDLAINITGSEGLSVAVVEGSSTSAPIAKSAPDAMTVSMTESASTLAGGQTSSATDDVSVSVVDSGTVLAQTAATYDQGYDTEYGPGPATFMLGSSLITSTGATEEIRGLSVIDIPEVLSRVRIVVYSSRDMSAHLSGLDAISSGPVVPTEYPFSPSLNRRDMGATFFDLSNLIIPAQPVDTRTIDFWYRRDADNSSSASYVYDTRTAAATGNPYMGFSALNVLSASAGQSFYINGAAKTPTISDFPLYEWVHVTVVFSAAISTPIYLNSSYLSAEFGRAGIAHFAAHDKAFTARDALVNHQMQTGLAVNTVVETSIPSITENSVIAYKSVWRGTVTAV